MGMFDDVILKGVVCPLCGCPLENFQTKDGPRWLNMYIAGRRYKEFEHLKHIGVYTNCIHRLCQDKKYLLETDSYIYDVLKVVHVDVKVPILSRGRISSDPKKYKVTCKVVEAKDSRSPLWSLITSQFIDEESFNFRKQYEEGRVRDRRENDVHTGRYVGNSD